MTDGQTITGTLLVQMSDESFRRYNPTTNQWEPYTLPSPVTPIAKPFLGILTVRKLTSGEVVNVVVLKLGSVYVGVLAKVIEDAEFFKKEALRMGAGKEVTEVPNDFVLYLPVYNPSNHTFYVGPGIARIVTTPMDRYLSNIVGDITIPSIVVPATVGEQVIIREPSTDVDHCFDGIHNMGCTKKPPMCCVKGNMLYMIPLEPLDSRREQLDVPVVPLKPEEIPRAKGYIAYLEAHGYRCLNKGERSQLFRLNNGKLPAIIPETNLLMGYLYLRPDGLGEWVDTQLTPTTTQIKTA